MKNDSQTFTGAQSLEQFGVICLTGEACGLAMRILCDLTDEGVELIREFMRVEPTAEPCNSRGVKSIMLPCSIFQELWIFAMVRSGARNVFLGGYVNSNQWTETHYKTLNQTLKHPVKEWQQEAWAVNDDDVMRRILDAEGDYFYINRWFRRSTQPGTGLDNRHAMSGRIV